MVKKVIPPPPLTPNIPSNYPKVWFYAGPIIVDALAIVCTTILCALAILPIENFKYLIGVLVVGNVALRLPGTNKSPPGGGGLIVAFFASIVRSFKT